MLTLEKELEIKAQLAAAIISNPNILSIELVAANGDKDVAKKVADLTEEVYKRIKRY